MTNCDNIIIHIVQPRDTVYLLAKSYNTSVDSILNLNPGIEIYNLQIGARLRICPGQIVETEPPVMPVPPIGTLPPVTPVPPTGPVMPIPPIETLPPITPIPPTEPVTPVPPTEPLPPVPPIAPIPPVKPVPPIGTLPSIVVLRELLLLISRWIRDYFGKEQAERIINYILDNIGE